MVDIILYTKVGCHLCDDVELLLAGLAERWPHQLQKVDITMDNELLMKYRYTIPVLQVGERQLAAPITEAALVSWLAEGAASNG